MTTVMQASNWDSSGDYEFTLSLDSTAVWECPDGTFAATWRYASSAEHSILTRADAFGDDGDSTEYIAESGERFYVLGCLSDYGLAENFDTLAILRSGNQIAIVEITAHHHYYDAERSAWQCRECDSAVEDCALPQI